ncbi:MAG TPA: hypothetical protein IAD40_05960 [Candidatus Scatomorpha merdavium]|jgi:uncharacterized membrane protein/ribosomal protein L40E|nr:hypothetical protein [Candidatus Scatomorpha merdavium]
MSYCRNCGAYVPDWAENCPACDMPVKEKAQPKKEKRQKTAPSSGAQSQARREEPRREAPRGNGGAYTYDGSRRRSYAESYDQDTRENQTMGYLCYLGPLLLIPLLARPKSRFLRYHCNQGLLLLIFAVLVSIFDGLLGIGWLIGIAGGIATLVWLVQGFMNVSRGLRRPLSFIGEITLLK